MAHLALLARARATRALPRATGDDRHGHALPQRPLLHTALALVARRGPCHSLHLRREWRGRISPLARPLQTRGARSSARRHSVDARTHAQEALAVAEQVGSA